MRRAILRTFLLAFVVNFMVLAITHDYEYIKRYVIMQCLFLGVPHFRAYEIHCTYEI